MYVSEFQDKQHMGSSLHDSHDTADGRRRILSSAFDLQPIRRVFLFDFFLFFVVSHVAEVSQFRVSMREEQFAAALYNWASGSSRALVHVSKTRNHPKKVQVIWLSLEFFVEETT